MYRCWESHGNGRFQAGARLRAWNCGLAMAMYEYVSFASLTLSTHCTMRMVLKRCRRSLLLVLSHQPQERLISSFTTSLRLWLERVAPLDYMMMYAIIQSSTWSPRRNCNWRGCSKPGVAKRSSIQILLLTPWLVSTYAPKNRSTQVWNCNRLKLAAMFSKSSTVQSAFCWPLILACVHRVTVIIR